MAKKPKVTRTQRAYVELAVAHIEEKRSQPFDEAGIQRILAEMQSEDELTRAKAVREICPCRMPDHVFLRLRRAAKRLQRDPSPLVRANALHIEEDARMVASFEAQIEGMKERDEREEGRTNPRARTWKRERK